MVRNCKKKGKRLEWRSSVMQAAVDSVLNNLLGYRQASKLYNVPYSTLEKHVKLQKADPDHRIRLANSHNHPVRKPKCVLTEDQEKQLVTQLINLKERFFVFMAKDIRSMAFQLATRNGGEHSFNKDEELAGVEWFALFQKMHPELYLKKTETIVSSAGVSKTAIDEFYDHLENIQRQGFTADRIFNAEEVGITLNPNLRSKIKKGSRHVAPDKGQIVSIEICCAADGKFMPPMLVFPSDIIKEEFKQGLPPGACVEVHESGWFTKKLFMDWFKKFVVYSKASKESPVLLLFNGHSPLTKNLDLIEYANDHGVIFLCFPANCSSRLEPLEVSFMKSLTIYYEREYRMWQQTHPGYELSAFDVSPLFGTAFVFSASSDAAMYGFKKTGIWPIDRTVEFRPHEFTTPKPTEVGEHGDKDIATLGDSNNSLDFHQFLTASFTADLDFATGNSPPASLGPITTQNRGALRGCKNSLTLLPISKSNSHSAAKLRRKTNDYTKNVTKTDNISIGEKKLSNVGDIAEPSVSFTSEDCEDDNDPQCLYCDEFFSNAKEGWWISCGNCVQWAHHSCAGLDDENDDKWVFLCKVCEKL